MNLAIPEITFMDAQSRPVSVKVPPLAPVVSDVVGILKAAVGLELPPCP